MAHRTEWRELLKLLKQAAQAQADPDEAVLKRIEGASRAALAGFSTDAAVAATAASFTDREELLGLLLSTIKVVEAGGFMDIDYGENQHGDAWCLAAARTAAAVLADTQVQDGVSDSCRPAVLEQQLAWLALFGRCCSYLHNHLQKSETTGMFIGTGGVIPPQLGRPGVDWYGGWYGPGRLWGVRAGEGTCSWEGFGGTTLCGSSIDAAAAASATSLPPQAHGQALAQWVCCAELS